MSGTNKARMSKVVAFLSLFGLAFFSALRPAMAEKKGAELVVLKSGGGEVKGELIAVRGETLLILDGILDVSVDLGDVNQITIVKKSYAVYGAGIGFLLGLVGGSAIGNTPENQSGFGPLRRAYNTGTAAVLLGGLGLAIGVAAGIDEKISLESPKTPREKAAILAKLTRQSRLGRA